jgi:mRNA-degrading endonuclease YafQ of YafQ-DinJ toxin-antitoxin module
MTWQLIFTDRYNHKAAKFIKQHPKAATQHTKTLELLTVDPHHPPLRHHALKGKLNGLHSVSINLKYRITLELIMTENEIIPIHVGDHDEVD